ncbi:PREDICTED: putative uncharacterized protein encoded by MIR7-3HG [Cercocebus atys]|uniref:putative uncharacterized protein encoded by MIR7-3HG n=1 Tax=Cercocebus atys TaxID=9531 RepID=UPI0005F46F22|nr:PREDICTED: putative uncharacterized protein encoded by MIR7-3HG [Cercocebus atys]
MRRNSWGSPSQDSWRSAFPEAYKSAGPCLGSHGTPASANKTGSRNGQRQQSLTVWKAEISGADCLGAPSIRTAPLGGSKERTAICFSTGAQDSSQRAPFRRRNPGQLPQENREWKTGRQHRGRKPRCHSLAQLGMYSPHLHPELPTTDPAFFCKLRFIKGNDPYCLTIAHVKSVLTFS